MSSIWYQFCSPSQTGVNKSRSCDFCGLTLERLKEPPKCEADRNEHAAEYPKGAFVGWSSFSRVLKFEEDAEGNPIYHDLHVDFCAGCTTTVWDKLLGHGIDEEIVKRALVGHQTIYLDALGREVKDKKDVEGQLMCHIGPSCLQIEGHDGPCSSEYPKGMIDCPACRAYSPALLFTVQGLENHAINEHDIVFENKEWRIGYGPGRNHRFGHVTQALLLLNDVRENPHLWNPG